MLPTERQMEILAILSEKKSATVSELCARLFSSGATIRRDLAQLEQKGLLCRSHGGAILMEGGSNELSLIARARENVQAKSAIARLAAEFISDGKTLFCDSSSTVCAIVPYLTGFHHLTVITNGLHCALELSRTAGVELYLPAGQLVTRTNSLVGSDTLRYLDGYNADIALLSCSGLSLKAGVSEFNMEQSRIKQVMLKNSATKLLLCDTSKLDKIYFSKTCDISDFDRLICERDPGEQWHEKLSETRCRLIFPKE